MNLFGGNTVDVSSSRSIDSTLMDCFHAVLLDQTCFRILLSIYLLWPSMTPDPRDGIITVALAIHHSGEPCSRSSAITECPSSSVPVRDDACCRSDLRLTCWLLQSPTEGWIGGRPIGCRRMLIRFSAFPICFFLRGNVLVFLQYTHIPANFSRLSITDSQ